MERAYEHDGVMINSGAFNGTRATNDKGMKNPAIKAVIEYLEQKGIGKHDVNYRYRDWLISRQRFEARRFRNCIAETHGWNPVPDTQLLCCCPTTSPNGNRQASRR
ncbi:MAG: hypothetical protein U0X92_11745 [Anaerolineales bacterium]